MCADSPDYRDSVFLPETDFPMRAGLPQREPDWLARWERLGVYEALRAKPGRPPFTLHDGPPYANGHLHIGHALNKILKDMVVRSQQMMGADARYVPGWDCHGLPIEWKIEEQYRAKGLNKDDVDKVAFRQECRAFAAGWIDVQRAEFKRLGVTGTWDDPYRTMDFHSEAVIAAEFMTFVMNGALYQGSKPVMWSPVEKTALAEAEVEYHDVTSHQVWVRFPVKGWKDIGSGSTVSVGVQTADEYQDLHALIKIVRNSAVLIWTTTPWTIPQNRAISFSENTSYGLFRVDVVAEHSAAIPSETLLVADNLAETVFAAAKVQMYTKLCTVDDLNRIICAHPLPRPRGEWRVGL